MEIDELIRRQQARLATRAEPKPEPPLPPPAPKRRQPSDELSPDKMDTLAERLVELLDQGAAAIELSAKSARLCAVALKVAALIGKKRDGIPTCPTCLSTASAVECADPFHNKEALIKS